MINSWNIISGNALLLLSYLCHCMNIRLASPADYPAIMRVWESSVKATHHFLQEADFLFFKDCIPKEYLPQLNVYVLENGDIRGFIGVGGDSLEMLFIDADARGKGYGKRLLQFALDVCGITHVDVNEQNEQAVGFYKKMGFVQAGRSERDGQGKDYPVLHMVIS